MKKLLLIMFVLSQPALAALSSSQLKTFSAAFAVDDSMSRVMTYQEFDQAVAPADRASSLVQLWDASPTTILPDVRSGVLGYLTHHADTVWNTDLAQRLMQSVVSKDADVRRVTLNVWKRRPVSESRAVFTTALDDTNESNRISALRAVRTWSDASTVLTSYVSAHEKESAHADSVTFAKNVLAKKVTR